MQDFRSLRVWHLAKDVVADVSRLLPPQACRRLPGFHSQIMRAAVSISANIAEGCGKQSRAELRRYLETSLGSLLEVQSNVEIALACKLLRPNDHIALSRKLTVLRRMLTSLHLRVDVAGVEGQEATAQRSESSQRSRRST